ncbi:MAG TPA: response regulator [Kofleriaceae bacterium]|nr:response regulator [Kofleriaceae bacterium]
MPNRRILLVEDDPDIRADLAEILVDEGFHVDTAAHGAIALDRMRMGPLPDLVLLDLMMPVMDGFQFRAAQVADPQLAAVPVLVLSGAADMLAQVHAIKAQAVVRKPFRIDQILQAIGKALPEN